MAATGKSKPEMGEKKSRSTVATAAAKSPATAKASTTTTARENRAKKGSLGSKGTKRATGGSVETNPTQEGATMVTVEKKEKTNSAEKTRKATPSSNGTEIAVRKDPGLTSVTHQVAEHHVKSYSQHHQRDWHPAVHQNVISIRMEFKSLTENQEVAIRLNQGGQWTLVDTNFGLANVAGPEISQLRVSPSNLQFRATQSDDPFLVKIGVLVYEPIIGGTLRLPQGGTVVIQTDRDYTEVVQGSWYLKVD